MVRSTSNAPLATVGPTAGTFRPLRAFPFRRSRVVRPLLLAPPLLMLTAAFLHGAQGVPAPSSGSSPAARRAAEVVELIQSGDLDAARQFIMESYAPHFLDFAPMETHLGFIATLHATIGSLEEESIVRSNPSEASILFRSRLTEEWSTLTVGVETEPPHRVTSLRPPSPASPPPGRVPQGVPASLTDAARAQELDSYIRKLADADAFSGAVLVSRDGTPVFQGAYGEASREFGVPNRVETRFILGSINKMFTAVAILQQVERGHLRLDDPVSRHLPGVLPEDVAVRIRIEHLLTHTSGLGDFLFTPEMWPLSRARFRGISDYLSILAEAELRFEPGTRWGYSNTGYLLLGAILEKVTGRDYFDYVSENIFEPAGMTATGSPELDMVPLNLASGYERHFVNGAFRLRSDRYEQVVRGTPAGGGFSSVADMMRFGEALRLNRLLLPETTRMMLTPKPELGSPAYGFGAGVHGNGGVGHTGGGPGTNNAFEIYLETGVIIVALGNIVGETGAVVRRARFHYLRGGDEGDY